MTTRSELDRRRRREAIERWARAGIDAVRPDASIGGVLQRPDGFWDRCAERGYILLSFGKASLEMAQSVIDRVGAPIGGLVVTHRRVDRHRAAAPLAPCEIITASHPVPDEHSLRAGRAAVSLLTATAARVPAVVLISGGASSLIEIPRPGVHLGDLQLVNDGLLRSGLPITSMNVIRQALSDFKGGGLAQMLGDRPVRTMVISDVVGNDTRTIASGPMSAAQWNQGDPWDLCPDALRERVPTTIEHLLRTARPISGVDTSVTVIADAGLAARAALDAATGSGYPGRVLTSQMEGDATDRARWMLGRSGPGVSICAGETTVVVTGGGSGGRNQHGALTWATEIDDPADPFVGLAIGTDGRDGPTDAAGGLVDGATAARIRARGGDPIRLLADDDSNRALSLADDVIAAEPTGTNVGDLWIVVR